MKKDQKRWEEAQAVEADHPYHDDFESRARAERYLRENFHVEWNDFAEKRVLEVGSGTGHIHSMDHAEIAMGVDPLYSKIDISSGQSVAELATAAGEHLPFPSNSFDTIICINVLDHTLNPSSVINELARVLREDGELLFELNVFEIPQPIRSTLAYIDPPHPHHFSSREAIDLLTDAGFSIQRKDVHIPSIGRKSSMKRIVARAILRLRMLTIVARHV